MTKFLLKYKYELILFLFIVVYVTYFTAASFLRYDNFYTGRFDLGNMSQTVWNTSQGRIFQLTDPNGTQQISRLSIHADFLLVFFSPFYYIWNTPKVLLFIQTLVLGFGAIFVYLISKEVLKNKLLSFVLASSFLLYPAVEYSNLYDFHSVTLATTFLLACFYFILKKNYKLLFLFLFLSGLTKENVWVTTGLIGIYLVIRKKILMGVSITFFSGIIFYYLVWHAIPVALGSQHFALSYYSDFGASPTKVVLNVFLSPNKLLGYFLQKDSLDFIRQLFLPLGYSSFIGLPFLIFASPSFLIDLLSNNPQLHQIYYQYSSTITPFVFISSIYGLSLIHKRFPEITFNNTSIILIIFTFISALTFGPLPFSKTANLDMFIKPVQNKDFINSYLKNIPVNKSIASTNNLGSHLSEREKIYTVPLGINSADYVMFLLTSSDFNSNQMISEAQKMYSNKNYKLVVSQDNFLVFKKLNSTD